jgi:hypothetical protein
MHQRKYLTDRGWPLDRVLALTDREFDKAAEMERQMEKSAIIQRIAFQRIHELRAEIAELKGGLVG